MRLWSLHPKFLDAKGLVALWREGLLAKHVLEGRTKGYRNHPQLVRFKEMEKPVFAINQYLAEVYHEAVARGYRFDRNKLDWEFEPAQLTVTIGQMKYETEHLLRKLQVRDETRFDEVRKLSNLEPHPMFKVVEGEVEEWEKQYGV